jgi:hypothetical protein
MITLASDCLLFELANGENVPLSAEMISVELSGDNAGALDPHFVEHAAKAVFHYFKHDLGRMTVTVGEFACAMETVLRGFDRDAHAVEKNGPGRRVLEADLLQLASESGKGCELFFFPRLRDELRHQLQQTPQVMRFRGLRGCAKQLAGARRWNLRCQVLQDQIVEFLRECLSAEARQGSCSLVVE